MKTLMGVILFLTLSFTLSFADGHSHRFPMDLHDLGLTPQQHKEVEEALKEYQHAYRIHHTQNEKGRQELNRLFIQPVFDEELFRTRNMERERGSVEIQTRFFSRLHRILTPEQKRRFIRHIQEWEVE